MINEKHYVGEVGTVIYVNCGLDVSSATSISVVFERPDGTVFQRSAIYELYNASKNYVKCIIQSGDINQSGEFHGQVALTLGSWTGRGAMFIFQVDEPASSSSSSCRSSSSSSSSSSH